MKQIKVCKIGVFDMLKFKNLPKKRLEAIANASEEDVNANFPVNNIAQSLHPYEQKVIVKDIIIHNNDTKTIVLKAEKLAYFKAGQYITVNINIDGNIISRPYSLSSCREDAMKGMYCITIKRAGLVSGHILDNLRIGDNIMVSAPNGHFYYNYLRDKENVVAFAGGIGITPFLSMAKDIYNGIENFNLTLFYIAKTGEDLIFKDILDNLICDKFKVIYATTREKLDGYHFGHISKDILKNYKDHSIFICGSQRMLDSISNICSELSIKNIRYEAYSNSFLDVTVKTYNINVIIRDKEYNIPCKSNESIIVSLEKAGIKPMSSCRTGSCGFCHSKLISGNVLEKSKNMRMADKKFGFIHTCSSYPLSDLILSITTQ